MDILAELKRPSFNDRLKAIQKYGKTRNQSFQDQIIQAREQLKAGGQMVRGMMQGSPADQLLTGVGWPNPNPPPTQEQGLEGVLWDSMGATGGLWKGVKSLPLVKPTKKTGWFKSPYDKQWRFEIDDSKMKFKKEFPETRESIRGWLDDFIKHDELFESYPRLKNLTVEFKPGIGSEGAFTARQGAINNRPWRGNITVGIGEFPLNKERVLEQGKKTLIHEIQHAVQEIEGFAKGGSPGTFAQEKARDLSNLMDTIINYNKMLSKYAKEGNKSQYRAVMDAKLEHVQKYRKLEDASSFDKYQHLAGEIEAREASLRKNLTAEQRKIIPAYLDGIKPKDAILRYGGGSASEQIMGAAAYKMPKIKYKSPLIFEDYNRMRYYGFKGADKNNIDHMFLVDAALFKDGAERVHIPFLNATYASRKPFVARQKAREALAKYLEKKHGKKYSPEEIFQTTAYPNAPNVKTNIPEWRKHER